MTRRYRDENDRMMWDVNWDGSDDGYEYSYDYSSRPKLRRNKIDGILGGVCAGLGDWLGIDHGPMRIFFVLAVIFTGLPILVYFLMWIFIPSDKRAPYNREERERRRAGRKARRSGSISGECHHRCSASQPAAVRPASQSGRWPIHQRRWYRGRIYG